VDERQFVFLRDLTGAAGPSGYEGPVRAVWRASVSDFAAEVHGDTQGSITAIVNPSGSPRVMLAGHIDEIGLMVSNIDEKGFLSFVPIGGHDASILVGQRVHLQTSSGPVLGVIGRKPIHLMNAEDRKAPVEIRSLWIDIGVANREEAQELVRIGDTATFVGSLERLRGDRLVSKAFDNRVGAYVAAETARAIATGPLHAAVFAVGTCQEEIGYRGAITSAERIKPDVAIAIDVGFGLDHPEVDDEKKRHNGHALGKGPQISRGANVNPIVFDLLVAAAKEENIPIQIDPAPGETGTDGWAIQVAHHGVATGVVSVSLRYMHSPVEVLSIKDLDQTVALLAAFIRRLDSGSRFIVE
jgi:putative aminopeptidase FrvX